LHVGIIHKPLVSLFDLRRCFALPVLWLFGLVLWCRRAFGSRARHRRVGEHSDGALKVYAIQPHKKLYGIASFWVALPTGKPIGLTVKAVIAAALWARSTQLFVATGPAQFSEAGGEFTQVNTLLYRRSVYCFGCHFSVFLMLHSFIHSFIHYTPTGGVVVNE
jgi:hypothetical protein